MAGPSWTQRSDRPIVWHAERCVNQDLADRILELSNATAQAQTPFEGVARIHQILEQGDPALVLIRRLLARRTQLPLANFEPMSKAVQKQPLKDSTNTPTKGKKPTKNSKTSPEN